MNAQGPQPKRRFCYRRVAKTEFCLTDLDQTNEQQRNFNDKPSRELHGEVLYIPFKPV